VLPPGVRCNRRVGIAANLKRECPPCGATRFPPERDFNGPDLERGTGIPGAELRGLHLRLPGHGDEGPTLEIFNYNFLEEKPPVAVNRPGFGHIAFVVDDVPAARDAVLAAGERQWEKW